MQAQALMKFNVSYGKFTTEDSIYSQTLTCNGVTDVSVISGGGGEGRGVRVLLSRKEREWVFYILLTMVLLWERYRMVHLCT